MGAEAYRGGIGEETAGLCRGQGDRLNADTSLIMTVINSHLKKYLSELLVTSRSFLKSTPSKHQHIILSAKNIIK